MEAKTCHKGQEKEWFYGPYDRVSTGDEALDHQDHKEMKVGVQGHIDMTPC